MRKSDFNRAYAFFYAGEVMEEIKQNKMGTESVVKLVWKMGLPMIVSMILQSVYNIVDTAFVINMGEDGVAGNLALTYAFPVQLLIIAIGVGTGVGINALLSKQLGEKNADGAKRTVGNGIFLGLVIYAVFLIFGLFGCRAFIAMQARGDEKVIKMGTNYLKICCCFSFGSIGYTVYERFLQATGKTLLSTIAQISGAVCNIILDYVFIYPLNMGIEGAAWATVIGQILSLAVAMIFHYGFNKDVENGLKALIPDGKTIKSIYKIGVSAAIMQGLLSVMMLGLTAIFGTVNGKETSELLQGSFGIYYKIMQFALFASFGISNTIISLLSYNYGLKDKARAKDCVKHGILSAVIVSAVITVLFESLAVPLAKLFGMASGEGGAEIQSVVIKAVRIASIGYVFMAFSVAVQGVLQALGYAVSPLIISFLRLCALVMPVAYLFTLSGNPVNAVWWAFPIVEVATAVVSAVMLKLACRKKISVL